MVPGTRRFRFVLQTLLAAAAVLGCVALVIGSDDSSDPTERSAHLLDLLSNEPQGDPARKKNSVGKRYQPKLVPEVPPEAASVSLPIRVALVSQTPIDSVQPGEGTVCTDSDGRPVSNASLMLESLHQPPPSGSGHSRLIDQTLRDGGRHGSVPYCCSL